MTSRKWRHEKYVTEFSTQSTKASLRFIRAGMGDALSTWFEARQNAQSRARNTFGARSTQTAQCIVRDCYRTIREFGLQALSDLQRGQVTETVERIIEACIYQSGLGFEGGGLSAAHGLTRGLSRIEEMEKALHGEQVAYALLVQLVLEEIEPEKILELMQFYRRLGLPYSLTELGLAEVTEAQLDIIAQGACIEQSPIQNMVRPPSPEQVRAAMVTLQRQYLPQLFPAG
jgi:glycerol dehydrogenase